MFSFSINCDEGSFDFLFSLLMENANTGPIASQNLLFAKTKSHNDVCLHLVQRLKRER